MKVKYILMILISTIILQGCSWIHMLQIVNSTNSKWQIEFSIEDDRGIFKNQIYTTEKNEKEGIFKEFDSNHIAFELEPNQTVRIGMARNSHYKVYNQFTKYNEEIPWKTFINVDEIKIFNDDNSYVLKADKLQNVLSKNSRGIARVEIQKILESSIKY